MMDKSLIALVLKVGFLLGIIDKKSIVSWADFNINIGDFDNAVLELSLIKSKTNNEIISLLNIIANRDDDDNTKYTFNYLMCLFCNEITKNPKLWSTIEKYIVDLGCILRYNSDEVCFLRIEDDYSLRKEGFSGCMNLPNELISYLSNYDVYSNDLKKLNEYGVVFLVIQHQIFRKDVQMVMPVKRSQIKMQANFYEISYYRF